MNFIGNRYEILNCAGEIDLNKIYKARDAYDNKKVLIKVIEHNPNICEDFVSNLIDESTMIKQMHSPYILKIIDVGIHCTELTTLYYIVSEYSEGIGLDNLISGNYLHLEAIINISTQILKALEVTNTNNVYHGDLNPGNIIVDEMYNVKIFGFGTTKANNGVNLRVCNEIRYLCPHQLCVNYTDEESDYFALGLILFESIFKKLPFGEANNDESMLRLIDKGVAWNELKAINGNNELIDVIKRLLSRDKKYNNIQDIIIDLSSIMYEKADIEEEVNEIEEFNEVDTKDKKRKSTKLLLAASMVALVSVMILSVI
ncbi:protein kinase domain-containing protein [[Clostridium] dakarense]|uniref:protein kinase domain-containing protein n=1 Tax=Faecalimicrobium dakarense TaxID=1301100 RepID=UPI0004BC85B2|nr:protein kinase [[Clostridium] dakarense]